MPSLKNSNVYRCGSTAPHYNFETKDCGFSVNKQKETVDFHFDLTAAGGGTTEVWLAIGKDDLGSILHAIAENMPDQASVLLDCAVVANKKIEAALLNSRNAQDSEQARAKSVIEMLGKVEEFVTEKYYQAPAGQDERESAAKAQLQEVIKKLRSSS